MRSSRVLHYCAVTIICCSFILLPGCKTPEGDVAEGERWYKMHNCQSCHGTTADNGRATPIAGINMGFGSFVRYLRDPDSPSMPSFSTDKLSVEDAADIYVWLKTIE